MEKMAWLRKLLQKVKQDIVVENNNPSESITRPDTGHSAKEQSTELSPYAYTAICGTGKCRHARLDYALATGQITSE
uniref:Uncharacterized protein n=1 Tax=Pristionchus pacificus TaxID=54126 RepID=A0A2A6CW46_PRIPA|eukprot:PDM82306.1 hypothetical protein PRIPAC_36699 [Pristionchus pacificus]